MTLSSGGAVLAVGFFLLEGVVVGCALHDGRALLSHTLSTNIMFEKKNPAAHAPARNKQGTNNEAVVAVRVYRGLWRE
eukprot:8634841-Pyramimonas_sp.AAC.1